MSYYSNGLIRGYDYEDTPRFEAEQEIEHNIIQQELERRLENDPRN